MSQSPSPWGYYHDAGSTLRRHALSELIARREQLIALAERRQALRPSAAIAGQLAVQRACLARDQAALATLDAAANAE